MYACAVPGRNLIFCFKPASPPKPRRYAGGSNAGQGILTPGWSNARFVGSTTRQHPPNRHQLAGFEHAPRYLAKHLDPRAARRLGGDRLIPSRIVEARRE